jgi:uncharacterized membrane protein
MAPLICLIAAFLLFRLLGLEWHYFADWHMALRAALGAMFLLTASAHWGKRRSDLVRMVPESMGNAGAWVSVTGFAEIAIAAGLQIPGIAPWIAGIGVVMLCCLFPANVKAAREHLMIFHRVAMPLVPRLLLQIIFVAALIGSVSPNR